MESHCSTGAVRTAILREFFSVAKAPWQPFFPRTSLDGEVTTSLYYYEGDSSISDIRCNPKTYVSRRFRRFVVIPLQVVF